jgi:integrase
MLQQRSSALSPKGRLRSATYRVLFGLIAVTGLRFSEALRLQCNDVDLDTGMLTVRQTKFTKSRLVPLHPTTVRALKQYLPLRRRHLPTVQDGPFLASARGTALAKRTVHWVFDRLRKQLGWTARGGHAAPRIHDLRHTFITHMIERGISISLVQTMVGHLSPRMVRHYTHIASGAAREAVSLLDSEPMLVENEANWGSGREKCETRTFDKAVLL